MIAKFIIFALAIYAVYFIFFKKRKSISEAAKKEFEKRDKSMKQEELEESFVACKKCGVFVSQSTLKDGTCQKCLGEKQ